MTLRRTTFDIEKHAALGLPVPEQAARAVAQVLSPLARLMIDHGLQLPSMIELLKAALVNEAVNSFGLLDKESTNSRIALITGVHRKDIKRLREAQDESVCMTPTASTAASVVARWISEPRFLNADQTTRKLARTSKHAADRRGVAG